MLEDIRLAAETELEAFERAQEQGRMAYAAQELRRREQEMRANKVHRRRRARARLGLAALFELCLLPEIMELAKVLQRHERLSEDDPGFEYYYAGDDQEYSQVLLYTTHIIVDYGGAYPNCKGQVCFSASDTLEQLNECLDQISSFGRFDPLAAIDLFGTLKGFSPDLDSLAYQVLIDAASPRLLRKYFNKAINRKTGH